MAHFFRHDWSTTGYCWPHYQLRLKSSIAITGRGEFKRTSGSFDRFSGRTIFAVGFDVQSQMSLTMPPSKNW
ncbi:hypothetical protein YPPY34_0079 [Yersinia pestis PY-34]|nr:hypothetical protein YPPY34_0079 [Yersinia pestis PY-34]EIS13629.1 hypothetical protein YPPY48_0041 [Yersinia pestis PY-48]EIT65759.1 hypothetical protein YPPY113_0047 [Yersinia pestis PY-113]